MFLVVLALVVVATGASLLATAALGLIAFVPLPRPHVLPLQLVAWLLRGLVFQYIGLTSVGAYLKLYRRGCQTATRLVRRLASPIELMTDYDEVPVADRASAH